MNKNKKLPKMILKRKKEDHIKLIKQNQIRNKLNRVLMKKRIKQSKIRIKNKISSK